ncbi:plu family protein [Megaselia abdita]
MSDLLVFVEHPEHLIHYLKTRKDYDIEKSDSYGNTPLLKACYLGETKSAQYLLSYGANIDAINSCGQSTLNLALWSGVPEIVELILSKRSYQHFVKSSLIPPICVAELRGWDEMVVYLQTHYQASKSEKTVHGLSYAQIKMLNNPVHKRM